ncbi:MAG: hypothetical protein ACR2PF_14900 [Rhizobiaceae bacterium]
MIKTAKKKTTVGTPRYHSSDVLEFICGKIAGMFEYHKSRPFACRHRHSPRLAKTSIEVYRPCIDI